MSLTYLLLFLPFLIFRINGLSLAAKFIFIGLAELVLAFSLFTIGNVTQSIVIVMAMMLVVPAEIIFLLSFATGIAIFIIKAIKRRIKI